MVDYARKMLDQLMGPNRNEDFTNQFHFTDPMVCKNYLVDFCPYDLFTNTKSDMGACPQHHEERLRNDYRSLDEREKDRLGYDREFYESVKELVRDLDRRTRRNLDRLEMRGNEEVERMNSAAKVERDEKIVMLEERIKQIQARIEKCGEEGLIDEAKELDHEMDNLNVQLQALRAEETRERHHEVCMVCGSLLVANDVPERRAAHLAGKQHLGYKRLRETYDAIKHRFEDSRRSEHDRGDRGDRDRERDRDRRRGGGGGSHYDQRRESGGGSSRRDDHHRGGEEPYNRDSSRRGSRDDRSDYRSSRDDRSEYRERGGYHDSRSSSHRDERRGPPPPTFRERRDYRDMRDPPREDRDRRRSRSPSYRRH